MSAEYLATGSVDGGWRRASAPARGRARATARGSLRGTRPLRGRCSSEATGRDRIEAMTGLGQLAHREGRHRDAIHQIEQAVEEGGLDPVDHPTIAETLARAYAEIGESAQAVALLGRCVERVSRRVTTRSCTSASPRCSVTRSPTAAISAAPSGWLRRRSSPAANVADPYARARLYWSQSRLLAEQGNPAAAERYARQDARDARA